MGPLQVVFQNGWATYKCGMSDESSDKSTETTNVIQCFMMSCVAVELSIYTGFHSQRKSSFKL